MLLKYRKIIVFFVSSLIIIPLFFIRFNFDIKKQDEFKINFNYFIDSKIDNIKEFKQEIKKNNKKTTLKNAKEQKASKIEKK